MRTLTESPQQPMAYGMPYSANELIVEALRHYRESMEGSFVYAVKCWELKALENTFERGMADILLDAEALDEWKDSKHIIPDFISKRFKQ